MRPHPLTNFEVQKLYQNEPRFNGVFSRDDLPKIKDGPYVINLDEYSIIETNWVSLYVHNNNSSSCSNNNNTNNNNLTYFDSFSVDHIPKEIKTFIDNRNITTKIFGMQAYDSIMCGYFCI